jgi:hypothetical protein
MVLKGSVGDVRQAARRAWFLPINGVEIICYGQPVSPSCDFFHWQRNPDRASWEAAPSLSLMEPQLARLLGALSTAS